MIMTEEDGQRLAELLTVALKEPENLPYAMMVLTATMTAVRNIYSRLGDAEDEREILLVAEDLAEIRAFVMEFCNEEERSLAGDSFLLLLEQWFSFPGTGTRRKRENQK